MSTVYVIAPAEGVGSMSEFCEHETFKDICGICHRDTQITALRAEVERLKKEALFIAVSVLPEKDAQIDRLTARVKELEEALKAAQPFIGWAGHYPTILAQVDAALTPQPEKKPRKKRGFVWPKGAPEDGR